jgi:hypothetical protein
MSKSPNIINASLPPDEPIRHPGYLVSIRLLQIPMAYVLVLYRVRSESESPSEPPVESNGNPSYNKSRFSDSEDNR